MVQTSLKALIALVTIVIISSCNKDDKDTTKPWIVLKGYNPVYTPLNEPYVDSGAIAYDINLIGDTIDISKRLIITNNVNTSEVGKYEVIYNVEDEAGNEADEVTRTVYVQLF